MHSSRVKNDLFTSGIYEALDPSLPVLGNGTSLGNVTICAQMTDVRSRRLLHIALVTSHLSYASEVWAPQSSGRDLALLEGVQRRATKFILRDYELPYRLRLIKLNLLPISYWLELKDLLFFLNANRAISALTFLSI